MTIANADIDELVRRVVARLTDAGRPAPAAHPAPHSAGTLELAEPLVTLASIEGRLDVIERVVVGPGAVVTPAVRDLLRARGIALVPAAVVALAAPRPAGLRVAIVAGLPGDTPTSAACVGAARLPTGRSNAVDSPARFAQRLATDLARRGIDIERLAAGDLAAAIDALSPIRPTGSEAAGAWAGVLITDEPEAALCLANRRCGIRAAWALDPPSVARARARIGANMWIVEPGRLTWFQLLAIVSAIGSAPVAACPAAWQGALA